MRNLKREYEKVSNGTVQGTQRVENAPQDVVAVRKSHPYFAFFS